MRLTSNYYRNSSSGFSLSLFLTRSDVPYFADTAVVKKPVSLILIALMSMTTFLSACAGPSSRPVSAKKESKTPFAFDGTTAEDARFALGQDSFETAMAVSPFYEGEQRFPENRLKDFETGRRAKVKEIVGEADRLAKATRRLAAKTAGLRSAYLDFLNEAGETEPKLKNMVKVSFTQLAEGQAKAAIADAQYRGLKKTESDNGFARAYIDHLRVYKAMEGADTVSRDVRNIAGSAAFSIELLSRHKSPAIKRVSAKLDREMERFDELLPDLADVADSQSRVAYGLRQLETADYYLARETEEFIADRLPEVKRQAAKLEARGSLGKEDIAFIRSYADYMGKLRARFSEQLREIDKERLIAVDTSKPAAAPTGLDSAWAGPTGQNYAAANQALSSPADPGKGADGWLTSGWNAVKSGVRKAKTAAGVTLDVAGVAVRNISQIPLNIYAGADAPGSWKDKGPRLIKEGWQDMQANTREITNNYNKGISGATTLKTAGEYLESLETGAQDAAAWGVEGTWGKGRVSHGLGWFSKTFTGMFTGLGKGVFKLAKTGASNAELIEGTADVTFSFIGGSKVLFKASQVPGLFKGLAKSTLLTGKAGLNFFLSVGTSREKAAILKEMAKSLGKSGLTQAEAAAAISGTPGLRVRQAMLEALTRSRGKIAAELGLILKGSVKSGAGESVKTVKGSLNDLLHATFEKNMRDYRKVLNTVGGATTPELLDNLIGSMADDIIKNGLKDALAEGPSPLELNGEWAGQLTITQINDSAPPPPRSSGSEGCDIDVSLPDLKGKALPMTWKLALSEQGGGTALLALVGSAGRSVPVTYTDGQIQLTISDKSSQVALGGAVSKSASGAFTAGGGGTMSSGGTWFAKVTWSMSKK